MARGQQCSSQHREAIGRQAQAGARHPRPEPSRRALAVALEGDAGGLLYLDADDVIALYAEVLGCDVAEASDQLRNPSGLDGAIARPLTHAMYSAADVALQAAVLAHGIAESQLFIDGNKRIALIAMLTFLDINGRAVEADDVTLAQWILDLSAGLSAEELAQRLRGAIVESQ